jgi:hypothetical protein
MNYLSKIMPDLCPVCNHPYHNGLDCDYTDHMGICKCKYPYGGKVRERKYMCGNPGHRGSVHVYDVECVSCVNQLENEEMSRRKQITMPSIMFGIEQGYECGFTLFIQYKSKRKVFAMDTPAHELVSALIESYASKGEYKAGGIEAKPHSKAWYCLKNLVFWNTSDDEVVSEDSKSAGETAN